jgi:hypothetical protein
VTRTALEKIADREQAPNAAADHIRAQIEQPAERLRETDSEPAELIVARKVTLALGEDEPAHPRLPDNPVYQQILTALPSAPDPLRAPDLCHAPDPGPESTRIEGMRSKPKRPVATGPVAEDEPGLFTPTRPQTDNPEHHQAA